MASWDDGDMSVPYTPETTTRADIDRIEGVTVVQFGTNWCGICQRAQPLIDAGLAAGANARLIKVEDGSGRPLGRSFKVRLWPTLVFLRDGREVARVVRPDDADAVARALRDATAPA
jgi:thioredoxin 1